MQNTKIHFNNFPCIRVEIKKSSAIGTWKTPYRSRSIIIILTLSRYKNRIINSKQEEKNSLHISIYFSSIRTDFQASQIHFYSIIFSYLIENLILCFDLFIDFMFYFPWQIFLSDLENLVEVFLLFVWNGIQISLGFVAEIWESRSRTKWREFWELE